MEIAELVNETTPFVTAAIAAYGGAVLSRAETAAADATANVGRRILQAVWQRSNQSELDLALQEAADDPNDPDTLGALRHQIKRVLRENPDLTAEIASMLPPRNTHVEVSATGDRSIAAQNISGFAITGDNPWIQK